MFKKGILYNKGELDVLPYYCKVASFLKKFLKGKKIATKIHLPNFFFLKRGSNSEPFYIEDFSYINEKMLELRKFHLKEIREKLNKKQELIWEYFPPRKLIQFFYATNDEGIGKPIERIFIDIDRRKNSEDDAKEVAKNLIDIIKNDKEFSRIIDIKKIIVLWTGNSFHVYIILKKTINLDFYNDYLSYGEKKYKSFINKWALECEKRSRIDVRAGHEKSEKFIILDSSNTPSGKLARTPFSLHVKDWKTIDGVCVPISYEELNNKNLIKDLKKISPDSIIKNLKNYEKFLQV